MFLDPRSSPGFKRSIFNAIVAPRPIGWISSMGADGSVNLAPFSQFNLVSTAPPVVMFACNRPAGAGEKDTVANVRETGEFVVNMVSWDLREAMNMTSTSLPRGADEFEYAGLSKAASRLVSPPRVEASPANLECRLLRILEIEPEYPGETFSTVILGRVLGLHMNDALVDDEGRFDTVRARPLTRLGGYQYAAVGEVVEMPAPFARSA